MINIFNALLIRATELSLANCGVEVYHNLITGMDSRSEVHVTLEKCCGTLRKFETLLPRVIRSLSNRNVRPHDGKALTNFGPSEQTMSPKRAYRAQL
ncbi:hypothetical protein CPSG_07608 [Coccidioides posadasii str. Silveira]|uniref:Uncharacterized protein n=1 Tax=Coccidioides posadasii (strain RMSCC 757 / Silveira) TaxID=443226 RepID=E9DCQ6_COCPS|nr:hypothetical protein CPSG_07608 [Coccidioides posadasii str. Silveira]